MRIPDAAQRSTLREYGVLEIAEQAIDAVRERAIAAAPPLMAKHPEFLRLADNFVLDVIPRAAEWRGVAHAIAAGLAQAQEEDVRVFLQSNRDRLEANRTEMLAIVQPRGSAHAIGAPVFREAYAEVVRLMRWPEEEGC